MNKTIEITELNKQYGKQRVINNFTYTFPNKGLVGLVGYSGSGKSTLLNIISGLEKSYSGSVKILGKNAKHITPSFRLKNLGYIFQNYSLFEVDTSLNNVLMTIDAISLSDKNINKSKAIELLKLVGLEKKIYQRTNTLSGGEKQRVCIARALSTNPKILLCDEPTGALDEKNGKFVFDLLKSVSKDRLVILASHDKKMINSYCDEILEINKSIIVNKKCIKNKNNFNFTTLKLKKKKTKSKLSLRFIFSHSFNSLKAKKWRTIICLSGLIVGLVSFGLSVYVTNCISNEITEAFNSFIPKNEIVMSPYNVSDNQLSHIYSASLGSINSLKENYEDIKDYGISYIVDYESFFADDNRMYALKGSNSVVIPSISARTANDFLWLDDYPDLNVFPERKETLENDEIILGLPYSDMVNLCYGLQILRNFESLGNYIHDKGLKVVYSFANYSWSYEDEQIFNVAGVISYSKATIFHSNHQWNEFLFEESMRFPTNNYEDNSLPWILNKVYYIETYKEISKTLKKIREEGLYNSLLFEPPSYQYEMTHCEYGKTCNLKRLYVYECDKETVPYNDILNISKIKGVNSKIITTIGSYLAYPSSLMIGFSQKFFLTQTLEGSENIIDSYSTVKKDQKDLDFTLPDNCIDGNYLKTMSNGLKLSSDFTNLIQGEKPLTLDEIGLSSSLYEKWNSPEIVYCVAQVYEEEIGDYIHRDFRLAELKVTSVIDKTVDTLFVSDDWTIDFFRDYLGMTCFYLEPTGSIFEIDEDINIDDILDKLNKEYPTYKFVNPNKTIEKSIQSTTDYIGFMLKTVSIVTMIISILLFSSLIILAVQENQKESIFLNIIGVSKKDIVRIFSVQNFMLIFGAFLLSSMALLLTEIMTKNIVASSFGMTIKTISFNFEPIIVMLTFCLLFFCLSKVAISTFFRKKQNKL